MPNEDFTGRKIAGYKLKSRVGEGGTATVYQADHPDHGRCAVKILKQRTRSDPIAVKRFLREAGYGAKVQHSAVVRTYDFGLRSRWIIPTAWAAPSPLANWVTMWETNDGANGPERRTNSDSGSPSTHSRAK